MRQEHLRRIREAELEHACAKLQALRDCSGKRLLELGAGAGWQAAGWAERGLRVHALEVSARPSDGAPTFPVMLFDGRRLPFADGSFDLVFSSNVLEHAVELDLLLAETRRVLRPGGRAIHVLPSGTWRLWTNLAHLPWVLKTAAALALARLRRSSGSDPRELDALRDKLRAMGPRRRLARALHPGSHGPTGNAWSEVQRFSRPAWQRLWRRSGWRVLEHRTNELFYTGCSLLGGRLHLGWRQVLAGLLGSAAHIFVLEARGHCASQAREGAPAEPGVASVPRPVRPAASDRPPGALPGQGRPSERELAPRPADAPGRPPSPTGPESDRVGSG